MRKLFLFLSAALLLSGCAASKSAPGDKGSKPEGPPAASGDAAAPGKLPTLQVEVLEQTTDGQVIHMRGRVTNQHSEPADGIRIMLAFATPIADGGARIDEIQRTEVDATLTAGGSTAFSWDVTSEFARPGARFALVAFPKRLGDRDISAPPEWDVPGTPK